MIEFSLLLCVYAKENPEHFSQCLDSILAQTVLPNELIIVKDGPLTEGLESVLRSLSFPNELKIVALPENLTQGPARAEGVKAAMHDWVAVIDSDDVCRPDRFEKQLEMIKSDPRLGLIGGQIAEFKDNPDSSISCRMVPVSQNDIAVFAKRRNPFNSMTVLFKRDLALRAGNYGYFPWFEDYDLWARMIKNGAICANHPDVLVDARVGSGMYRRRRGVSYIRSEWRMQKRLKALGFINSLEFARNALLRIPVRLLPGRALAAAYNVFARNK